MASHEHNILTPLKVKSNGMIGLPMYDFRAKYAPILYFHIYKAPSYSEPVRDMSRSLCQI